MNQAGCRIVCCPMGRLSGEGKLLLKFSMPSMRCGAEKLSAHGTSVGRNCRTRSRSVLGVGKAGLRDETTERGLSSSLPFQPIGELSAQVNHGSRWGFDLLHYRLMGLRGRLGFTLIESL